LALFMSWAYLRNNKTPAKMPRDAKVPAGDTAEGRYFDPQNAPHLGSPNFVVTPHNLSRLIFDPVGRCRPPSLVQMSC
jgi:hypothetical protein